MIDRMDTTNDYPSFEFQSTHVSYQEQRWLNKQRQIYHVDESVQTLADLHTKIRNSQYLSLIPSSLSTSSMIKQVTLDDEFSLYYTSVVNGCTDNQIDQFRLYNQQFFQLVFHDICQNRNYQIFIILLEGIIFYSSQTVKEYTDAMTMEMRKCLSSFHTYIQSRSKKLLDLIFYLQQFSLPFYAMVHTIIQNNIGVLFQFLPKIFYQLKSEIESDSLVTMDEYGKHTLSSDELRYFDYLLNMKTNRHKPRSIRSIVNTSKSSFSQTFGSLPSNPLPYDILHSFPIVYPYDDNMIYHEKYPSFWTGDIHRNEDSASLFQNIPIQRDTLEFFFVQHLFHKTVPDSNFEIAIVERIQNPHLWEKYSSHRSYMRRKNDRNHINENWLFHGTNSDNHHHIMSHGFNRSYCRDSVYYGRGVYFSRYACYSCHYGDQKDLSFLFLCRVLVGYSAPGANDIRFPPKITLSNGKEIQADSTTDHQDPFTIVCTFHDNQQYPEYIITYTTKSSTN